jgi:hypothetical protein
MEECSHEAQISNLPFGSLEADSLQKIAQLFDCNHSSVQRILAEAGGICSAKQCRSRLVLTLAEREEILRSVVAGKSARAIAMLGTQLRSQPLLISW